MCGVGGRWEVKGGRRGLKTAEILLAESCREQVSLCGGGGGGACDDAGQEEG